MKYHFQEGHIDIPASGQDETINIIKLPEQQASLVITRTLLKEGQTMESYRDNQIAVLQKSLKKFLFTPARQVKLLDPDLIASEMDCEYEKTGQKIYQQLLVIQQQQQLIVLAYTQNRPFSEEDLTYWQQVKNSYQPAKRTT